MTKVAKVSKAELSRAKADTRLAIIGELAKLIERLIESGWTQTRIAERLGVSRAHISQLLSAPEDQNWTIDTLASLLAAVKARITRIEMRLLDEIPPVNETHPWLETSATTTAPSRIKVKGSQFETTTSTVSSLRDYAEKIDAH